MNDNLNRLMTAISDDVDAVMVTSDINRRYYTGFPSSAGTLLAMRNKAFLFIDSRYFTAARSASQNCEVILQIKLYEQLNELIEKHGVKTVAVEEEQVSAAALKKYGGLVNAQITADAGVSAIINSQRKTKSHGEISSMLVAQSIADETFEYILEYIDVGLAEKEIALEMEFYSRKNGSEAAAFSFIVSAGENSAVPHHVPGEYKVKRGDFITMDFGCVIDGYCSDMTRTIAVGGVSEKQKLVYDTVLKAQLAALDAIKPGVKCKDIDKVARDIIEKGGFKGLFGHGLGHSLGLEVHEPPNFNPSDESVTQPGLVMSVEPGIYIPGEFGVRIEDVVTVTEYGHKNFAKSTKELIIL